MIKNIVLSFILLFLFGCATGYHKIGLNGGYESEILENGNIHITYWGNGYTALAKTIDYWERQAHELCPNGFEVLSRRDVCEPDMFDPLEWFCRPTVEGEVRCIGK